MATYKLIQDIEAEDHILGPLSLRQFLFALGAAFLYYLCFLMVSKLHADFLLIIFLPPALFCTFFAFPFGKDQPTEVWALAKLRFLFKPRQRVWDQSGVKEMVTITAPKKIERVLTNGLSETEVKSRLKALANTIDSRGWAVKGVDINTYSNPDPIVEMNSDRLVDISNLPQQVPDYYVPTVDDDMLDTDNSPVAQQFDQMILQSEQNHRRQLMSQLAADPAPANPQPTNDYWFMNPTGQAPATVASPVAQPVGSSDAAVMAQSLARKQAAGRASSNHLKTIKPIDPQAAATIPVAAPQHSNNVATGATSTPSIDLPDPAILSLASNNDLDVATLARQAQRARRPEPPQNEVVIPLH